MNWLASGAHRAPFGFTEWFRKGEYERVRTTAAAMRQCGAQYLRTHLSWAEYHTPGGREWYDWLIPQLGQIFDLLPCVHYTPPSLSRTGHSSGPPRRLRDYADFVDSVLTRYGEHFTHVELWNEPNNLLDWDWRVDPDWLLFCEMIGDAAHWAEHRGWRTVLGGPSPFDSNWLRMLGERGVLGTVSVMGLHRFPGTWDSEAEIWRSWAEHVDEARRVLEGFNPAAQLWITEAGYSTWRQDEAEQVRRFEEALAAPAQRLYWYGWQDLPRTIPVQEGLYFDPRHYHLGVTDAAGRPKLLRRLLADGRESRTLLPGPCSSRRARKPNVILGGAGFIGSNLAATLAEDGEEVLVYDNLARPGVEQNLEWLRREHGSAIDVTLADIRDPAALAEAVRGASAVFHFAAQVAVTSSLDDPEHDFSVNAAGTFNVLEAMRKHAPETPLVFASTNKVYGGLADVPLRLTDGRWMPQSQALRLYGIDETRALDFCTPYGCSKGAADQYVLDYAGAYGLRSAVLRMSCIYGPHQFGTEDQGWVAHFLIRALENAGITIYGDGNQVRDILYVDDAIAAYRAVVAGIDTVRGQAFNLGGGPDNAVSLHEVLTEIAPQAGTAPKLRHEPEREGDQRYFVADTRRLTEATGWRPLVGWRDGLLRLGAWLAHEHGEVAAARASMTTRIPA